MTVKEIAEICGVSKVSIQKWCKRNNIQKTINENNVEIFDIDSLTAERIKEYYANSDGENRKHKTENVSAEATQNGSENQKPKTENVSADNQDCHDNFAKYSGENIKSQTENLIDILNAEIQRQQLQIEDLLADKKQLYKQIDGLQEQLKIETMERQTILSKYLIMNEEQEEQQEEVKATVVEPEPVKAEQEPTEQEEQPQQKQGFFAWLFKRK